MRRYHLLDLLVGKTARSMRDNLPEVPGATLQMIKFCPLGEECPRRLADSLTFILLLDTLSTRQMNRGDKTIIRGTLMKLVVEETPTGPGTKMGMIGTRETPDTTRMLQTIDQPEALMTEGILRGSNKKSIIKINDLPSVVVGGSLGTMEFFS